MPIYVSEYFIRESMQNPNIQYSFWKDSESLLSQNKRNAMHPRLVYWK